MDGIKGEITNLRFSSEVNIGNSRANTQHIAIFKINGQPVEIKLNNSLILEEGDDVYVVGNTKDGVFKGVAYKNISNGVIGKAPTLQYFIAILILLVLSIASLATLPIFAIFLLPLCIYTIFYNLNMSNANDMIDRDY